MTTTKDTAQAMTDEQTRSLKYVIARLEIANVTECEHAKNLRALLAAQPSQAQAGAAVAWECSSPAGERPALAFLTSKKPTVEHYENQGWRVLPLYTRPTDSMQRRDAEKRHWNPVYNTDPVQRACGELPEGWEIEILLENGAGTVYLINNNCGERIMLDNEDEFDWTIHEAIDAALPQQKDKS